jgi:diacylglycerol kinase family enzyme
VKRALVIMNRRSGSASAIEEVGEAVSAAVLARGLEPEVHAVEPGDLLRALARAERGRTDLLVIGGGDGTVRYGAVRAMEIGVPLAVLPMGTMNLVAKDLALECR